MKCSRKCFKTNDLFLLHHFPLISHINSVGSKHFISPIKPKPRRCGSVSFKWNKRENYENVIKPFRIDLSKKSDFFSLSCFHTLATFSRLKTFIFEMDFGVLRHKTICLPFESRANRESEELEKRQYANRGHKKKIIPISRACSREITFYLKTHHVGKKKWRKWRKKKSTEFKWRVVWVAPQY